MNKNKGFTLIELLVVIAIIGILASVVLASLSGARTKAKIAAMQSTVSSARSQAEIGIDAQGKYVASICSAGPTVGGLSALVASLNKAASKVQDIKCAQDTAVGVRPLKWAFETSIFSSGTTKTWYCSDSTGYSGPSINGSNAAGTVSTLTNTTTSGVPPQTLSSGTGYSFSSTDVSCAN